MTDDEVLALGKKRAEELGLMVERVYTDGLPRYIAYDIHRLLGSAREIKMQIAPMSLGHEVGFQEADIPPDRKYLTHTAYAIGIREIKPESKLDKAKQLLKELIAAQEFSKINVTYIPEEWAERARALLAGAPTNHSVKRSE